MTNSPIILAIESSCDETSAAVLIGRQVRSNIIASQKIHEKYGGVVPELASRAHQSNIIPVVSQALEEAEIVLSDVDAIACTSGPGLLGALLVGVSFAKSLSLALGKPLILVDHMKAHIHAHFISRSENTETPSFPMLCLTVSGGHTQIVKLSSELEMEVVGKTLDDAAGEAFDKGAKILGLPYPGGPLIDKLAQTGDPNKFQFTIPETQGLSFSFSGLKTNLLYFIQKNQKMNEDFVEQNLADICASYQSTIVRYLIQKLSKSIDQFNPESIGLAGGVSANSLLRQEIIKLSEKKRVRVFIPTLEFTTDNAAMIGATAYFMHKENNFSDLSVTPNPRAIF